MAAADFDGDGDIDLATSNHGSNTVSVLLNAGNGTYGASTPFAVGTNPNGLTSADLDGDGDVDLATANVSTGNVSVLRNTGNGSYGASTPFVTGSAPFGVTSADIDGDGDVDLATANFGSTGVSVLRNDGSGSYGTPTAFATGVSPIAVNSGDFDRDGVLDLVATNWTSNTVAVLLGDRLATAGDDSRAVTEDSGATSFDTVSNDVDADGDAIEITNVTDPANGVTAVAQGSPDEVSYTPDANYCNDPAPAADDTFTYTVSGGDTATMAVTVTCVDDAAVANNDARTVTEDSGATGFDALSNDSDQESDPIDVTAVSDPAHGTAAVVQGAPDQVSYTPDTNYCNDPAAAADDTFTYTVSGGDTATMAVTVTCVDDAAVANDDTRTVSEDSSAQSFDVLSNDTDSETDTFEITEVSDPANGVTAVVDDQVTYTPDANYCNDRDAAAHDTFAYTVTGGATATVSVTVTCVDEVKPPLPPVSPTALACPQGTSATVLCLRDRDGHLTMIGTDAGETFVATAGADRISGRGGNDTITALGGDDVLTGGRGNDVISAGAGDDRLYGDAGHDRLSGGSGRDRLSGGTGNDLLAGTSGADRLYGNAGNDRLSGGTGTDRLYCGSGRDSFSSAHEAISPDCRATRR